MKKLIAVLLLAVVIALPLVSCANGAASDAEYIEKKGTLVIGITYFEPMNYMENGEKPQVGEMISLRGPAQLY